MILVAFAILSLIAMASVGAALRGRVPAGRGAAERAIFNDQISEIDRDEARGLIGAEEAKAARTEIQRRLVQDSTHKAGACCPAAATCSASRRSSQALRFSSGDLSR